jgi:hypothetical protein
MKNIVALIFIYFSNKNMSIPHFRTIMVFSGFFILHLFLIYKFFSIPNSLNIFGSNKSEIKNWLPIGALLACVFLVLSLCFKKRDLEKYSFTRIEINVGIRNMLIYFCTLLILIVVISTFHIHERSM